MTTYSGTDNLEVMAHAVNYNNFLIQLIRSHVKEKELILDFGAGIGLFAEQLKALNYNISCIEQDKSQLVMIRKKGIEAYSNIDDIEDNSVDYIYSLNVLEHIEDDVLITEKLYKKLKNGGKLLIYVPAFQVLYSSMDKKVGHYRRYSKSTLSALVKQCGFKIITIKHADSAGFFATILYKFFGSNTGTLNINTLVFYDKYIFPISHLFDSILGYFFGKNIYVFVEKNCH